ncbi:MAG: outer rane chaperone Skp (OmpH) [Firmicutes bacterium]|nr:outer rane chaperone Skp (OmpH) [Bacillota bacterium]
MLRSWIKTCFVAVVVVLLGITAGCNFNPFRDTKPSLQSTVGLINMADAIKNHPKNANLQKLQNEYNMMVGQTATVEQKQAASDMSSKLTGLNDAANEEFNTKMVAKQNEMNTELQASAKEVEAQLGEQMDAYTKELQKEYESRIISLQLKMKTLELSKEQAEALNAEADKLQKERSEKISAKHQELAGKLNEIMADKQAAAKTEIDDYGQKIRAEIGQTLRSKQTALQNQNALGSNSPNGVRSEEEQKIVFKQQEIKVLQDFIINDIKDKVAVVAAKLGLELVLTEAKVNVNAVDITSQVTAEINK